MPDQVPIMTDRSPIVKPNLRLNQTGYALPRRWLRNSSPSIPDTLLIPLSLPAHWLIYQGGPSDPVCPSPCLVCSSSI
jgi:hypothetical protein